MKRKIYGFIASTKYYIPSSKCEMQFAIIGIILFIVIHFKSNCINYTLHGKSINGTFE